MKAVVSTPSGIASLLSVSLFEQQAPGESARPPISTPLEYRMHKSVCSTESIFNMVADEI